MPTRKDITMIAVTHDTKRVVQQIKSGKRLKSDEAVILHLVDYYRFNDDLNVRRGKHGKKPSS